MAACWRIATSELKSTWRDDGQCGSPLSRGYADDELTKVFIFASVQTGRPGWKKKPGRATSLLGRTLGGARGRWKVRSTPSTVEGCCRPSKVQFSRPIGKGTLSRGVGEAAGALRDASRS